MQGRHILILALCCLGVLPATAQTIYRCGNSYSQTPCAGGNALALDDKRDKAQEQARKAQADAATRRDLKTAATLEKSRLKEEAARGRGTRAWATDETAAEDYDDAYPVAEKNPKKPPYFTARAASAPKKKEKTGKNDVAPLRQ